MCYRYNDNLGWIYQKWKKCALYEYELFYRNRNTLKGTRGGTLWWYIVGNWKHSPNNQKTQYCNTGGGYTNSRNLVTVKGKVL